MTDTFYERRVPTDKRLVFIIDDDRDFSESISDVLETHGYIVEVAHSVKEAKRKAKSFPYNLALVDIRIGRNDGLNLIPQISQVNPHAQYLVMTAFSSVDSTIKALKSGASDYLIKPISVKDLLNAIERSFSKASDLQNNQYALLQLQNSARQTDLQIAKKPNLTKPKALCGHHLTELTLKHLKAKCGSLFFVEDDCLRLHFCNMPELVPDTIGLPLQADSILSEVLESGQPQLIHNTGAKGLVLTVNWSSCQNSSVITIPIKDPQSNTMAIFILCTDMATPFTDTDLQIGAMISDIGYQALQTDIVTESLITSQKELNTRSKLTDIFLKSIVSADIYNKLLLLLMAETGSLMSFLGLYDPESDSFSIPNFCHQSVSCDLGGHNSTFHRSDTKHNFWWQAIDNKAVAIHNEPFSLPRNHATVSRAIAVPLMHEEQVIGLFCLGNKTSDYTAQDAELLTNICQHISPLIHTHIINTQKDSDRAGYAKKLEKSEHLYRLIAENANDLIITMDYSHHITYASPACKYLLQYDPNALIGQPISTIISAASLENAQSHWAAMDSEVRVITSNLPSTVIEIEHQRQDGSTVWAETKVSYILDEQNKSIGILCVSRDISKRKQATEELLRKHHTESVLNGMLSFALKPYDLDQMLYCILYYITNIPWLSQPVGALFLVENQDGKDVLVLKSYRGVKPQMRKSCQTVNIGQCLCGLAAQEKKIIYATSDDPRRQIRYTGANKHGYYCVPIISANKVLGVLNLFLPEGHTRKQEEEQFLLTIADGLAGIIERKYAEEHTQKGYDKAKRVLEETVSALVNTLEQRDSHTANHQRAVARLAGAIATTMQLPTEEIEGIRIAAHLHDIGMIGIPSEIISKPLDLNSIEYNFIKTHPQIGHGIIKDIEFNTPVSQAVLQHHERIDGSGYPMGLRDKEIILSARIIAVADVVEAIASHRPYRPALGLQKALEELEDGSGTLYDSQVVIACLRLFNEECYDIYPNALGINMEDPAPHHPFTATPPPR